MLKRSGRRYTGRKQAGLSLVELMVGMAVGMLVVAGAIMVVTTQLGDNRRLLLETQMQQDLRAAADIITRDLRRAGAWTDTARVGLWSATAAPQSNPYSDVSPDTAAAGQVDYGYYRNASYPTEYGFRLNNTGVLQSLLGIGWQDLTDAGVMEVTTFTVTPRNGPALQSPCARACAGGGTACWPTVTVRELDVVIEAKSRIDDAVRRSLRTTVRLRNDLVAGVCPP